MFNKKTKPIVSEPEPPVINSESLAKDTASILDIFVNTIARLKEVSKQANAEAERNQATIDKLKEENEKLKALESSNVSLVENFLKLLNKPSE